MPPTNKPLCPELDDQLAFRAISLAELRSHPSTPTNLRSLTYALRHPNIVGAQLDVGDDEDEASDAELELYAADHELRAHEALASEGDIIDHCLASRPKDARSIVTAGFESNSEYAKRFRQYKGIKAENSEARDRDPDGTCQVDVAERVLESLVRFLRRSLGVRAKLSWQKALSLSETVYRETSARGITISFGTRAFVLPVEEAASYLRQATPCQHGRPSINVDCVAAASESVFLHKGLRIWLLRYVRNHPGVAVIVENDHLQNPTPMTRPTQRAVYWCAADPCISRSVKEDLWALATYRRGEGFGSFSKVDRLAYDQTMSATSAGLVEAAVAWSSVLGSALSYSLPSSSTAHYPSISRAGSLSFHIRLAEALENQYRATATPAEVMVRGHMGWSQDGDRGTIEVVYRARLCTTTDAKRIHSTRAGVAQQPMLITSSHSYQAVQDALGTLYHKQGGCMFACMPSWLAPGRPELDAIVWGVWITINGTEHLVSSFLHAGCKASPTSLQLLRADDALSWAVGRMTFTDLRVGRGLEACIHSDSASQRPGNSRPHKKPRLINPRPVAKAPEAPKPKVAVKRRATVDLTQASKTFALQIAGLPFSPSTWESLGALSLKAVAERRGIPESALGRLWTWGRAERKRLGQDDQALKASATSVIDAVRRAARPKSRQDEPLPTREELEEGRRKREALGIRGNKKFRSRR